MLPEKNSSTTTSPSQLHGSFSAHIKWSTKAPSISADAEILPRCLVGAHPSHSLDTEGVGSCSVSRWEGVPSLPLSFPSLAVCACSGVRGDIPASYRMPRSGIVEPGASPAVEKLPISAKSGFPVLGVSLRLGFSMNKGNTNEKVRMCA